MLYTCTEDFWRQAARARRLSREEEREYAARMQAGDVEAKRLLTESYLSVLGAYIKRWSSREPSLDIIYRGIAVLEDCIQSFDFQADNLSFTSFLGNNLRKMFVRYIADGPV